MDESVAGHQTVRAETELVSGPDVQPVGVVRGAESRGLAEAQTVFGDDCGALVSATAEQRIAAGRELPDVGVPPCWLCAGKEQAPDVEGADLDDECGTRGIEGRPAHESDERRSAVRIETLN